MFGKAIRFTPLISTAATQAWMNVSVPTIYPGKETHALVHNTIQIVISKYFGTPEVYGMLKSLKSYLELKSPGTVVNVDVINEGDYSYYNGCIIIPGIFLKAAPYVFSTGQADVAFMKGIKNRAKEGKSWIQAFKDGSNAIHLGQVGHLGNENTQFATFFFGNYKEHIYPLLDDDKNILIDMGKGLISGVKANNLEDIMGHCVKHFGGWVKKNFCWKDNDEALLIYWKGVNAYTDSQLTVVRELAKEFDLKYAERNFGVQSNLEGKLYYESIIHISIHFDVKHVCDVVEISSSSR